MNRWPLAVMAALLTCCSVLRASDEPPNAGRGAGTVPVWNPHKSAPGHPPLTIRVLVLNYDPIVPAEGHRRLSEVFRWGDPAKMATAYKEALEYASGGYLRFDIVEWRNLNEIYAQENGQRYTIEEYVRNRRAGKGWREKGAMADYPRLLREQNVPPAVDDGRVDEVWIFSDHFFGLWEASMAGPGAFFINGGVYPQVPSRRPFAFYGFNYERGVAEMLDHVNVDVGIRLKGIATAVQIVVLHDINVSQVFEVVRGNFKTGKEIINLNRFVRPGLNRVVLVHADNGAKEATLRVAEIVIKNRDGNGPWKEVVQTEWVEKIVRRIVTYKWTERVAASNNGTPEWILERRRNRVALAQHYQYLVALEQWQQQMVIRQQLLGPLLQQEQFSSGDTSSSSRTITTYRIVYRRVAR